MARPKYVLIILLFYIGQSVGASKLIMLDKSQLFLIIGVPTLGLFEYFKFQLNRISQTTSHGISAFAFLLKVLWISVYSDTLTKPVFRPFTL